MASITVEVDLDDFDDDELIEEMEARGLDTDRPSTDDREQLEAIHHLMRMKKSREAYKLMYDYTRDRLGKAV